MASSMATLLLLAVDVVATAGADALDCAFPAAQQQQQQQPWLTASSTVGPFGHVFSDGAWSAAIVLQGAANHSSGSDAHGTFGGPLYRGGCRVGPKCKRPALGDPTVLKIAKAHNVSAAEVGMRWILQQGLLLATASAEAEYDTENTEVRRRNETELEYCLHNQKPDTFTWDRRNFNVDVDMIDRFVRNFVSRQTKGSSTCEELREHGEKNNFVLYNVWCRENVTSTVSLHHFYQK